jgi:hypothetical protein
MISWLTCGWFGHELLESYLRVYGNRCDGNCDVGSRNYCRCRLSLSDHDRSRRSCRDGRIAGDRGTCDFVSAIVRRGEMIALTCLERWRLRRM